MSPLLERPVGFERTLRSLAADRGRGALWLALSSSLSILAWGWWMVAARVPVYVTTTEARLQVEHDAQVLAAPLAGVVVEVRAAAGGRVRAGEVLYRLDARVEERKSSEARRRGEGLRRQLAAAGSERDSAAVRLRQIEDVVASRVAEAESRARAADAAAGQAASESARAGRLLAERLTSRSEHERLQAEADRRRAEAAAASGAVTRLRAEASAERQELAAELARRDGELARLAGELAANAEAMAARAAEVDRHVVRAPFAGRVGETAVRRRGAVVAAGEPLATVVPEGAVGAVAFLPAAETLGRIRPGQRAELRLAAFPWTEHGSLPARVVAVEEVAHEDRVRVDLALLRGGGFAGPRDHGLRATALIEVERRPPLHLVVRGLGRPWGTLAAGE